MTPNRDFQRPADPAMLSSVSVAVGMNTNLASGPPASSTNLAMIAGTSSPPPMTSEPFGGPEDDGTGGASSGPSAASVIARGQDQHGAIPPDDRA